MWLCSLVAAALAAVVEAIDYTNFKNSVLDEARHDAYLGFWEAMHYLQVLKARPCVPKR